MKKSVVTGKVVGYEIDGLTNRDEKREMYDYLSTRDLNKHVALAMENERVQEAVKVYHKLGKRCFVDIRAAVNGNDYKVTRVDVYTDLDNATHAKTDKDFCKYFASYEMDFMIPFFIRCAEKRSFFAGIMGQPWIPYEEHMQHIKKK